MDIVRTIREDREKGAQFLEDEYKTRLMGVAYRLCGDETEAEHLVFQAFDEAIRRIETLDKPESFYNWLCHILVNCHAKAIRRKEHETVIYTDTPPDEAVDGAERVFAAVDAGILREAIESLPEDMKESVILHYFMDIPLGRIAKVLLIPIGTVKSRLHYARLILAKRLGATMRKPAVVIAALFLLLFVSAAAAVAVGGWRMANGEEWRIENGELRIENDGADSRTNSQFSILNSPFSNGPLAAATEKLSQNTISKEEEVKMNTSKLKRVFARTAAAIVAFASGNVSGVTWTGGAGDGLWNSPGNWSGNAVPTLSDNVVFENASPLTVTVASSAANARQVYVTRGDVTIGTSDSQSFVMRPSGANPDAENWNIVSVAKDATLTVNMQVTGGQWPRMYLAKEGKGIFRIGGKVTQTERVDVKEGTLAYNASADGFAAETPSIIRSGAVFSVESAQFARNDQRFELEEGSVMDFNSKGDVLGYISGGGTVRNAGGLAFTLPSTTPSPFYGRLENCTSVTMRPGSWGNTYDGHHYVVSNANAFASCDVTVDGSVDSGKTPYEATNVLRFASGIGSFNFGKFSAIKGAKINLADMEGSPVRVMATCSQASSANASFFGPGSLDMTVPSGETLAVTNDMLALRGDLSVTSAGGGGITLGTGSAEKDADFDVASLTASGANVVVKNTGDITWGFPVRMESSTLNYQGNGTLTLKDYRQRGNQLSVSSASAQGLVLENARLDSGADGTQLVLILPGAWEEPRLVFAGGSAYFKSWVAQGGVDFATSFSATDGADVTFNLNGILSTQGKNRAIVLESGATAAFQSLDLVKDTTGLASGAVVTGRVTLAGGTLEISKNADRGTLKMTATGENAVGLVEFKGGTLRSNSRGYSSAWPANSRIVTTVGAEGGAIDIARTTPVTGNTTITINNAITSGVDSGTDGGLVKRGMGTVEFKAGNTFTGGLTIEEGRVIDAASSGTAVGTGIVTLDFGQLVVANTITTHTYPGVSYCGAGAVMLTAAGQTATFASLERSGNGVLGLVHPNGQTLGSTLYVKSTATVPCHADGRVKAPIVGIDVGTSTGNHYSPASILKYDVSSGFMPADVQEGFVGATSETAVKVTAADQTLSSNTSIGALVIDRDAGGNALNINSGVTLHVGNGTDPALVLMNQYNNNGRRAYIAGQGTLDFGSSEGVIVVAASSDLGGISTKIMGTGGLTIAEPFNFETSGQCYHQLRLTGANTYTGGTRIYGVRVEAGSSSCFGCDYVEVGHGGQLAFGSSSDAMTIANSLRVCGRGVPNTVGRDSLKGAVLSERPATLTGNVTLLGDITFAARALSTPASLTFSGAVGGTGDVTIAGNGTVAFTGANTFAGDVTVDSGATLKIGKANSLSKAKVALNGVLRVELDADGVITNTISGSGLIMLAGTHQARFTGLADFVGRIVTDPAATMELDGKDFEGELTGEGTISNVGDETAEVRDTTAGEGVFGGSLAGDIRFVKAGEGTVTMTGTSTYNGGTVVADGTIRLGEARPFVDLPIAEGLSMHLDASAEGSVETNAAGGVTAWHDLAEPTRILIQDLDERRPSVRTSAMNGLTSVYFQGHHAEVSNTVASLSYQTFFAAVRPAGDGTDNKWGSAMLIGPSKKSSSTPDDLGVNCGGAGSWSVTGGALSERPPVWVNGQPGNTWSFGESHLFSFEKASVASFGTVGIGSGRTNLERSWYGDIGEIVAYSRALDPTEWFKVTRYMMMKWMPELYTETYSTTNVLPASGAIDIVAGATLDLNGTYQSVGVLTGGGVIANTSMNESVLAFDAGATAAFSGSVSNVTLSVNGGTVGELGEMTVDSSCSINLEENAKLDLGGCTVTVTNASGYGRVVNGRLIVLGKDTRRRRGFCMNIR